VTESDGQHPRLGDEQANFDAFFGEPSGRWLLDDGRNTRLSYPYDWPNERTELRVLVDPTGHVRALELIEGAPGPADIGDLVGPVDEEAARNDADAFLPAVDGGPVHVTIHPAPESLANPFPRTIWALQRA
jgi:hypothetical protein